MNVESFVETLKKLLRPYETNIVQFVYVDDDSYYGKKNCNNICSLLGWGWTSYPVIERPFQ